MSSPLAPVFVLGCSRLGSTLTPLTDAQSLAFIRQAYGLGVRHFDTASIYGQGDSERLLGQALKHVQADISIATKAGQRLTPKQQLLRPFKPLIRRLIRPRPALPDAPAVVPAGPTAAASLVAAQRARGVNYCFEPDFLLRSLQASLRRLDAGRVDIFYLHSPEPQALAHPGLWPALEGARQAGRFAQLGVSCDELDTAEAALGCPGVQVLQFAPDGTTRSAAVLERAARQRIQVYARLGARRPGGTPAALRELLGMPAVRAVLMGTTRADHLAENLQQFKEAAAALQGDRP